LLVFFLPNVAATAADEPIPPETGSEMELVQESPQTPGEEAPAVEGIPEYEYEEPDFGENKVSYPMLILRTVAVLGAIIVGLYLLFKFLVKNKSKIVTNSDVIKVLATYPLASNRMIQVVDIAGQVLVLGVSDSNINLITEVEDKEVVDRIKLLSSKETSGTGSFKDQFFKLLGGKAFTNPGQISNLSGYRKRINRFRKL
ncbi:MAG: flagellar biosynthetic protein FliO, partial [Candidatus Aenigmarchaeota archaeon]|nr:flagellar biosynthetic protein FliO [Candidatus Aenigmarchaeota archaeon]